MCLANNGATVSCSGVATSVAHAGQQLAGGTLGGVFLWLVRVLECYRLPQC